MPKCEPKQSAHLYAAAEDEGRAAQPALHCVGAIGRGKLLQGWELLWRVTGQWAGMHA
jgi:hypothetical protein